MHVGIASGFANHLKVDDRRFLQEELTQLLLSAELGFESIWMTEHHFSEYSISPNPLMYLAYIAGRHPTVRLGTQVIVAPWHDPVRLAEDIVLLDHMSGGRGIFGFGRGLSRVEYQGLRVDQSQARELFDETVAMVMGAFETGVLEGGEINKQPRRELRPRPFRSLKGRAFCASGSPPSMVAAAKLGLGRLYLGQPMVGEKAQPFSNEKRHDTAARLTDPTGANSGGPQKDAWLEAWHEYHPGETPVQPFASNLVFIDESGDRARELAQTYTANTFRAAVKNYELTSKHHGTIKGYESYSSMVMTEEQVEESAKTAGQGSIAGTPKEVLEQLWAVKEARDPQGMMPHLYTGGMPHDECMRSIRLFAKECLAEMKSWPSARLTIDGSMAQAAE
jgi:alkanesulfonate monooxygenase SsuD/methylene tetrahydromethanopterin reductase-like flavin-dependent oxidoreductase (luciferase family)